MVAGTVTWTAAWIAARPPEEVAVANGRRVDDLARRQSEWAGRCLRLCRRRF